MSLMIHQKAFWCPHQGWRYLKSEDAPEDVRQGDIVLPDMPPHMMRSLRELALL
ncbi:MAG: DUF1489 family protein [Pseudomonadota bacterium]